MLGSIIEKVLLLGIIVAALVVFAALAIFVANVSLRFIKEWRNK